MIIFIYSYFTNKNIVKHFLLTLYIHLCSIFTYMNNIIKYCQNENTDDLSIPEMYMTKSMVMS